VCVCVCVVREIVRVCLYVECDLCYGQASQFSGYLRANTEQLRLESATIPLLKSIFVRLSMRIAHEDRTSVVTLFDVHRKVWNLLLALPMSVNVDVHRRYPIERRGTALLR